jgi:protein-S-isoprenylcysteine O-methyltransferase Ste14
MVKNHQEYMRIEKWLYGLLFVVVLPMLLVYWAILLQRSIRWPLPEWRVPGLIVSISGFLMIIIAVRDLFVYGHGLPMNPYPPEKFVTQGIYAWFAHPIYLGSVIFSGGISLWLQSSTGLYIVSPVLALMTIALVFGYERLAMKKRFGEDVSQPPPLFALPDAKGEQTDISKKIAMVIRLLVPWLIVGYFVEYARCADKCSGAFMQLFDPQRLLVWFNFIWIVPMLYVLIRISLARGGKEMLHLVIAGTLATALGHYLYLILPAYGVDLIHSRLLLTLVNLTTLILAFQYPIIWSGLQQLCERVANSRRDWLLLNGRVRIISHSIYAFGVGAIGGAIASYVLGNPLAVLLGVTCALLGGAIYAQISWGSGALLRPFGYWGGVIGVFVGMFLAYALFHIPLAQLALTAALAAPFTQVLGRLRCLTQGCCHGVVTDKRFGIRVWQAQSRVVVLSGLRGQWILITQLYSMLFNLLLGFFLWAMWLSHMFPSSLILGMYFILTGIERFAEDAYRGEKQTRTIKGLKEPQWLAVAGVLLGGVITVLPSALPLPTTGQLVFPILGTALAGGLLTAFAMSIDFPKSTKLFSRLSG